MSNVCPGGDPIEIGPFNQTLFLGCSVSRFGMNLGWGSDTSTANLTLVQDISLPLSAAEYSPLFTRTQSLANNLVKGADATLVNDDTTKRNLQRTLSKSLNDTDIINPAATNNSKVLWPANNNGKKTYDGRDPGFIALDRGASGPAYDIMGVPVYFKFEDGVTFGGYVHSWKAAGSQGGSPIFDVEIRSFSSLLDNSWMIIDKYVGSISSNINAIVNNISLAVPAMDTSLQYNNTIEQGNIPNVFNVYGYLLNKFITDNSNDSLLGFQAFSAYKSEQGYSAYQIYNALVDLLDPSSDDAKSKSAYSPYGALVTRTVMDTNGNIIPTTTSIPNLPGAPLNLTDMGICPNYAASDGIVRSLLKLDISEIPVPPVDLFISGTSLTIGQFIKTICDGIGLDYYVSFELDPNGKYTGIIKIKTISRRYQPTRNVVKNMVYDLVGGSIGTTTAKYSGFRYGEEFNDSTTTRAMYIGGKQKRLLQVLSTHLALRQTTMVFDPYYKGVGDSFMPVLANSTNSIRVPDENSTRFTQFSYRFDNGTASAVGQPNGTDDFSSIDRMGDGFDILQGNYKKAEGIPVSTDNTNHPLYMDLICPYFGTHGGEYADTGSGDFNNDTIKFAEGRPVYWDKEVHQLKIEFIKNDITRLLTNPYVDNSTFIVIENEIRAAGAGFEPWFIYIFENAFYPDIAALMYDAFKKTYSNIPSNFFKAIQVIHWSSIDKIKTTQEANINPSAINMEFTNTYIKSFFADLQKVHSFFKNIHDTYYGKKFMVRTPAIRFYRNSSGKMMSDWEVSEDGAWEEAGNFIDDTMAVGSIASDLFADDSGKIGAILGYNANAEKATRDEWLNDNKLANSSTAPLHALIQNEYNKFTYRSDPNQYFYCPLKHSLSPDKYLYIQYTSPTAMRAGIPFAPVNTIPSLSFTTAHGESIPSNKCFKMYVKATPEKNVVFLKGTPRIITSIDSPINIGGGKNECEDSLPFIILHDTILACKYNRALNPNIKIGNTYNANLNRGKAAIGCALAWFLTGPARWAALEKSNSSSNSSSENMRIAPKAACPAFAAVPVQFNLATYGPWINHPGLVSSSIFNGITNTTGAVNNLVGGLKVEEKDDYVPWNYGGMDNLDLIAMTEIKDDVNYQQVLELGEINVVGFLLKRNGNNVSVGSILSDQKGGPIINNISIDIGENGVTSNYVIRTYTRKLGFFNRETANRFKEIAQQNYKLKKLINNKINNTLATAKEQSSPSLNESFDPNIPKPLKWSPVNVLSGKAYFHLNEQSSIDSNIFTNGSVNYSPDWYMKPKTDSNINPRDLPRFLSDVGIQEAQEIPKELKDGYADKSMMSLDGLLSPISFYPTQYGSTFSITKYPRSRCPICRASGQYSYSYIETETVASTDLKFDTIKGKKTTKTGISCVFCEEDDKKDISQNFSASPKETLPPYIIASGDDLTILSRNALSGLSGISGNPIINYSTLNPVLLRSGEFSCFQNRQTADTSAHCIDMVANGLTAPQKEHSLKVSYGADINDNFSCYDINYKKYCSDAGLTPMAFQSIAGYPNTEGAPANNMRFFGLRGPIMVHGWGYDTEGYPVPNASGEYQYDTKGNIKVDSLGNKLYKNQTQNADGTWTKPYKENTFYKGWGQMPGLWPVGPVDLRWDAKAKVWTVGANYKNVWIQIENDLLGNNPTRGQIISDLDTNPLPSGFRKLVFVKDALGINPAPRGAQIYCKYDSDSGFYEPIYNRPYITSGTIKQGSSVDIYQIYSTNNTKYTTTYENPLGFNVSDGDTGMFVFIGKSWVLQAYRC